MLDGGDAAGSQRGHLHVARVQSEGQRMDSAKGWRRLSDSEASVVTRPSPGASPPGMTERGLAARADETDQSQPVLPALRFHSFHGFLPERFQSFVLSDLKLVLNKMLFRVPSDEFSWHRLYDICPANTLQKQATALPLTGWVPLGKRFKFTEPQ